MPDKRVVVTLTVKRAGMCPVCFLPSVDRYATKRLVETGVIVHERLRCCGCGEVQEAL